MLIYIVVAIAVIILVAYIGAYIQNQTSDKYLKHVINWFTLLIILNIGITTFIITSYTTIKFKEGPRGIPGKRGDQGPQGRDGSCQMCHPVTPGLKQIRPEKLRVNFEPLQPSDIKKLFPVRPSSRPSN